MSGFGRIARRGFLIGSAAIAGGVAFGTVLARRPHPNPLLDDLEPGEASFNPWIKITASGIELITPHVDLGQGAVHMQALLIAEELDLELGQFTTSFGRPDPAYFNTALLADGAPFVVSDHSLVAETSRDALDAIAKIIGLQGTGGSTSVPDSFDKLRRAGAVARETLKAVAAQTYGIARADLTTQAGAVVLPDGTLLPYQSLAQDAAQHPAVRDVQLRSPAQWRLIGARGARLDVPAKSLGRQHYGIDMRLEGMVYAAVHLSPTRAPAISAELGAARATEGVTEVLEISDGFAVLADNTWSAMQGASRIEAEWAAPFYPPEQADHWTRVAAAFVPENLDRTWRDDGVAAQEATNTISAEYRAPYVAHQPLEPLNATILLENGQADIWAAHQFPRFVQQKVAEIIGIDAEKVRFHNQYAGGSFGHRLEFGNITCAAEIARAKPGTPIKLTFSREQDFSREFPRHISIFRATGSWRDGQVHGVDAQIAGPSVLASQLDRLGFPAIGPDTQLPAGVWNAPYALSRFRVRTYTADGLAPVSSWRSVGASSGGFFLESFLDELLVQAGADPLEERLRLCSWSVARGVLEAVGEMSDWGTPVPAGRGRGLAMVESFGVPVAMVVEVSTNKDGIRMENIWVAADAGTIVDPQTFESQVQGGVIWGLGHAINSELTFANGRIEQSNYHDAEGLRLYQTPEIRVRGLQANPSIRGIGEPPVPPAAPALANAVFAATGKRLREMPFHKFLDFV